MAITPAGKTGVWHTFDYGDAELILLLDTDVYLRVKKVDDEWEIDVETTVISDLGIKTINYNDGQLYDLCCDIGQAMQITKANKGGKRLGHLDLELKNGDLCFEGLKHDPGAVVALQEIANPGTPDSLVTIGVKYRGYSYFQKVSLCPEMHKALVLSSGHATYIIKPGARVDGQIYDPLFDARTTPPDYSKPPFGKPNVLPFFLRSVQIYKPQELTI